MEISKLDTRSQYVFPSREYILFSSRELNPKVMLPKHFFNKNKYICKTLLLLKFGKYVTNIIKDATIEKKNCMHGVQNSL